MAEKKNCGCGKKKTGKHEALESTLKEQCGHEVPSDVQGSYTGTPMRGTKPVQDADDL